MKIIEKKSGIFDVEVDGRVVGSGIMIKDEAHYDQEEDIETEDRPYLERFDIIEGYRRRGYGTKALLLLRAMHGSYILAPDNEQAQQLYERIGRKITESDYSKWGFAADQGFGVYEI